MIIASISKFSVLNGEGFKILTSPDLFCDAISWLLLSLVIDTKAGYILFLIYGFYISKRATDRHQNYMLEYGDNYPRDRKVLIPYLI